MSRAWSTRSLTSRGLCTKNLSKHAKLCICPNMPNCEVWVLLRRFASTAWKHAKTSTQTVARTDLAASPWQSPVSHFRPHPDVSGEKQYGCHSPHNVLPWFGTLWLLPISKNRIEAERTPVWYHWGDTGWIAENAWHYDRKRLPGSVPKMKDMVEPVSICVRELLRGWRRPIGFMVSFTIFTASVRKLWIPPCIIQISMSHVLGGQKFGHYEYKSRLDVREP